MADETLYLPQQPQPEPSALQQLWDARPWKDYATNPPSMAPQMAIALGLLHPRLGGATRDMGMAARLGSQGDVPAILPQGQMPPGMQGASARQPHAQPQPEQWSGGYSMRADPGRVPGNQNGNYAAPGRLGKQERVRAYESYIDSLPMDEGAVALQTFLRMQGVP